MRTDHPEINKFPSTAHKDEKGKFVPDPLNQPLAVAYEAGLCEPREMGDIKHPNGSGYCVRHQKLGCTECK